MQFKLWLEANSEEKILSLWQNLNVNIPINEKGVSEFASILSSVEFSNAKILFGSNIEPSYLSLPIYDAPISDNLLNVRSKILKNALGTINQIYEGSRFFFCMSDNIESKSNCSDLVFDSVPIGTIVIRFPPVNFVDNKDLILLKSIIRHECVHAHDWNDRAFREENPIPIIKNNKTFNVDKYTNNLYEARAMVEQLNYLLREIGYQNIPEIISVLRNSELSSSNLKKFLPFIENYLNRFVSSNEEFKNKSLDQIKIYKIKDIIINIIKNMAFKNFIEN